MTKFSRLWARKAIALLVLFVFMMVQAQAQNLDPRNAYNDAQGLNVPSPTYGQPGMPGSFSLLPQTLPSSGKPTISGNQSTSSATADKQYQGQQSSLFLPVNPPAAPSLFQQFLAKGENLGISTDLPLFGHQFFSQAPSTFAPVQDTPVPAEYVVGPGDEIMLRAWGQVDIDYRATVDRYGNFNVPTVGNVHVAGLKFSSLRDYLRTAIGRVYQNFDLDVRLGQLRSIQVFVMGQAMQPGTYTISALSTLVNALFAAGGPTPQGSLRHVQLKRNGQVAVDFDLYDLLLRGDKSRDVQLLPGDVIFIPPVGPLAAVAGNVNVPAIYELKGPTSLEDLLQLAGGLASTAYGQKVNLERIINRESRRIAEFPLDAAGRMRPVQDGDLVRVFAVPTRFDNAVTLRGNVAWPGRYPWREGMRIRDLIPSRDALINQAYWSRLYAQLKPYQQQPSDAVRQYENNQYEAKQYEAKQYGTRLYDPNLNEADAGATQPSSESPRKTLGTQQEVVRTLPEPNWDYAVIERVRQSDLSTELIPFNLGQAILEGHPANNLLLQPGDVITIFSKDDVQVPEAKKTKFVRLEGEVKRPGIYQVQPGDNLTTIIERAGGLTSQAYLFAANLTRESVRSMQKERLAESLDRLEQDINQSAARAAAGALSAESAASAQAQVQAQRALLARLRQIQPQGRIVLGLKPSARELSDMPPLALEDGDRLLIPARPELVNVMGSVFNQNAFIFRPRTDLGEYLAQAGGANRDGDLGTMYIIRADGSVISNTQRGWLRGVEGDPALPGDTLVVPPKTQRISWLRELRDITQIMMQIATTALIAVRL